MRVHCFVVPPVITVSANDPRWCAATNGNGNGDGRNRDRNHLFTAGPEIGSTFQPIRDVDVLSTRENSSMGRSLLHTVSIRWWYHRRPASNAHARQVGRSSFGQLCGNTTWTKRTNRRIVCRDHHFFHSDVGGAYRLQHETIGTVDRNVRRCSRRDLHHDRVAHFGHEHESCTDLEFRSWGTDLDDALGLFCRAACRDVAGGGSLSTTEYETRGCMREAQSP